MTISLFISRDTFNNREHFQSTTDSGSDSGDGVTTQALQDLMSEINVNNALVNSNEPISFDNLNINSISNDLLTRFENQLDLKVSDVDKNSFEAINNGGVYKQKYNKLDKDIAKLKLIKEELKRRRMQKKNQFHLKTVKKKLERLEKYDENDKLSMYSSCPIDPFPFNAIGGGEQGKYSLDLSRHPVKWYGLDGPELQNKLPYNYAVH
tara:strand:+ start:257 stop:880 length:624 start_codon:yes stop_codon:yes gene_type:complete